MSVIKMTDLDLAGKRVLIRADLNVPVKDGKVTSDARIVATLPTIKLALEKGAKLMITSLIGGGCSVHFISRRWCFPEWRNAC